MQASNICKNPARWLRFLLLLAGDIEPHPGPRGRGPLDLSVGFAPETSNRMAKCFEGFRKWLAEMAELDWDTLLATPESLAWALRGYGLFCFEAGLPRYLYVYSITAVQEFVPQSRPFMTVAWQIDKKWQIHEPGQCRSVLPPVVLRAACCLGALWNWPSWVGLTLLGFAAMLHPAEMLALTREDLIYPKDVHYDCLSLFVRISNPKTARFARRQHGRIDDGDIIELTELIFGSLPKQSKLYSGSIGSYRRQWNAVMDRLGVPNRQADRGATPGVLRGSGATHLYTSSEDINRVAWRGRWSRVRTLEYYLQEVGKQLLIHQLSDLARSRIFTLADFALPVVRSCFLAGQNSGSGRKTDGFNYDAKSAFERRSSTGVQMHFNDEAASNVFYPQCKRTWREPRTTGHLSSCGQKEEDGFYPVNAAS